MLVDKNIVAFGGGTGLSTMLRGLRKYSQNITAVVTVADDGGSSGMLRDDLGMLPPGDIRNCIHALANTDMVMSKLINYRFTEGSLKGHSFGNLFLAALNGISDSFDEAVRQMNRLLNIDGEVLPVTNDSTVLSALLDNGRRIIGESNIGHNESCSGHIDRIELIPRDVSPVDGLLDKIRAADLIIMGPGSLYTSIIPNMLVSGVVDAIKDSNALKFYVCNIMTQHCETDGYSVYDHVCALEKHSYEGVCDCVLVNNRLMPKEILARYNEEASQPVVIDREKFKQRGIKLIEDNLLYIIDNKYIRHNFGKVAELIMKIAK